MKGFLHNLVARARAESHPVRPRVPSMFEAPTLATSTPDERSVEVPAEPSRFEPAPREPQERQVRTIDTPWPAGSAIASPTSELMSARLEEPPSAPLAPLSGVRDAPGVESNIEKQTRIERTVVSTRVHPAEVRVLAASRDHADTSPAVQSPHASTVEPGVTGSPFVPKPLAGGVPTQSGVLATIHPAPGRGPPARQSVREPPRLAPEPEPTTVHINIGRIEVRAAHESSERPRAERPAPVMTLDDYLKSRNRP